MNIDIQHSPPHIILDNFFDDFPLISNSAKKLYPYTDLGSHDGNPYPGLVRKELYLLQKPDVSQELTDLLMGEFWKPSYRMVYDALPQPFCLLNNTTFSDILIGFYGNNDRYGMHHDIGFLTVMMYLHEETTFSGGDLILSNKKARHSYSTEIQARIEPKPNRVVIFPSCYMHQVEPIETLDDHVDNQRIAVSYFLSFKIQE